MKCPNCNSEETVNFFQEKLDCPHCGEDVNIEYYMCPECGSTFKMAGDVIYSYVKFSNDEFKNLFGSTKEDVLAQFTTEMMTDNIHSCLRCGGLSFEIEEGLYRCNKCGFEVNVEVIDE